MASPIDSSAVLSFKPVLALATLVNFIVLYLLLKKMVAKPLSEIIRKRQTEIETALKRADEAKEYAKQSKDELARLKKETIEDIAKLKTAAKEEVIQLQQSARQKIEDEINELREQKQIEIMEWQKKAEADLKVKIVNLVILATQKILRREIKPKDEELLLTAIANELDE